MDKFQVLDDAALTEIVLWKLSLDLNIELSCCAYFEDEVVLGRWLSVRSHWSFSAHCVSRNVGRDVIEDSFEVLCSEMDPSKGENYRSYQIVDRVSAAQPLGMPSYNF